MAIHATVYLNESPDHFFGYTEGDLLITAAVFDVDDAAVTARTADGVPMAALELIFRELNLEPTVDWSERYRADGHRSLSVGDVVVLGETAWAVASCGWNPVSLTAKQIIPVT